MRDGTMNPSEPGDGTSPARRFVSGEIPAKDPSHQILRSPVVGPCSNSSSCQFILPHRETGRCGIDDPEPAK